MKLRGGRAYYILKNYINIIYIIKARGYRKVKTNEIHGIRYTVFSLLASYFLPDFFLIVPDISYI